MDAPMFADRTHPLVEAAGRQTAPSLPPTYPPTGQLGPDPNTKHPHGCVHLHAPGASGCAPAHSTGPPRCSGTVPHHQTLPPQQAAAPAAGAEREKSVRVYVWRRAGGSLGGSTRGVAAKSGRSQVAIVAGMWCGTLRLMSGGAYQPCTMAGADRAAKRKWSCRGHLLEWAVYQ